MIVSQFDVLFERIKFIGYNQCLQKNRQAANHSLIKF